MVRRIVGLSGYAGSGKDEAAKALTQLGWTRLAFADPLRACALATDPYIPVRTAHNDRYVRLSGLVKELGWDEAKKNPEVRRILIDLGTAGCRRCIAEDVWILAMHRQMAGVEGDIVITDCRFPNESHFILNLGGMVIRIDRPGCVAIGEPDANVDRTYPDAVIFNHGTLEDLHFAVRNIVGVSNAPDLCGREVFGQ